MATKYTKNAKTDFPGLTESAPDVESLLDEIRGSLITIAVEMVGSIGDDITIKFKTDLPVSEETTLDTVVAAHTGTPLVFTEIIATKIAKSDNTTVFNPVEQDGKQVIVMSPSTEGLYTWLTARGDDLDPTPPSSGRGEGDKLYLVWDGTEELPSTKEVELDWMEPIELHDGHMNFDPTKWSFSDEWSFFVRLPACTPTPNGSGTGNCNLAMVQQLTPWDSGTAYNPGDLVTSNGLNYACISPHTNQAPPNVTYWVNMLNIIVPAAGDGAFDIDLDTAAPSPCGNDEEGYWNIADKWTEVITPNAGPVKGSWNLFDFANYMYFMKNLNCGDPRGVWDLDAYKAEWISSRWKLVFKCTRVSSGAAEIGGDIMCFRPGAL